MHILGICNGSINGNSEILLKAALLAAQESDPSITTSWIHAPSVLIPRNPKPLSKAIDPSLGTIDKIGIDPTDGMGAIDDRAAILEAILNADGLIIASPTYSHQPAGSLKAITDRILGPYTDAVSAQIIADGKAAGKPEFKDVYLEERLLKPRIAGFIVVAGSTVRDQITMALPTMHLFVYGLHAKVVDQHVFMGCSNPGAVLLDEENTIARAEQLGENIASQMGKPFDDAQYLGEEKHGSCPYCHLDYIELEYTPDNDIGCSTCGARGKLVVEGDGRIVPAWDMDCSVSCITFKGKENHIYDIRRNGTAERQLMGSVKSVHEKWKRIRVPAVPLPSLSAPERYQRSFI